jgi:hypothetical protein
LPNLQALANGPALLIGSDDASNLLVNGDFFALRTTNGNYAKVQVVTYGYDMVIHWVTYAPPPRSCLYRSIVSKRATASVVPLMPGPAAEGLELGPNP